MTGRMHSRNGGINVENLTLVEAEFNKTLAHVDNVAPAEGVASTVLTGVVEEGVGDGVDAGLGALDEGAGVEGVAADGAVVVRGLGDLDKAIGEELCLVHGGINRSS